MKAHAAHSLPACLRAPQDTGGHRVAVISSIAVSMHPCQLCIAVDLVFDSKKKLTYVKRADVGCKNSCLGCFARARDH